MSEFFSSENDKKVFKNKKKVAVGKSTVRAFLLLSLQEWKILHALILQLCIPNLFSFSAISSILKINISHHFTIEDTLLSSDPIYIKKISAS